MLVTRLNENPLIEPKDIRPSRDDYEVVGAFNAGATRYKGRTILLLRIAERPKDKEGHEEVAPILNPATGKIDLLRVNRIDPDFQPGDNRVFYYKDKMYLTSISHLRTAVSTDGIKFEISPHPAIFPQTEFETFGIEDPRITQIEDVFYITYKLVSEHGICTGLLKTTDFENFTRMGIIFCPENIDVVIFPGKVNGKFYALTRPVPKYIGPASIWIASSDDIINWGSHKPIIVPRAGQFDGGKVGASCVPIKTVHGWLEIYHGADENDKYSLAAALFELNNPSKLIARSKRPLMQPEAPYETQGFYGNVVFSCGAVTTPNDLVTIYYGASDESTAAAVTTIDKIMSTMD
jgi:predicted GH43/DUF377 family glycosyl hydrolase